MDNITDINYISACINSACHNQVLQLEWLHQEKFIFSSAECKAEIKVTASLASSEGFALSSEMMLCSVSSCV